MARQLTGLVETVLPDVQKRSQEVLVSWLVEILDAHLAAAAEALEMAGMEYSEAELLVCTLDLGIVQVVWWMPDCSSGVPASAVAFVWDTVFARWPSRN